MIIQDLIKTGIEKIKIKYPETARLDSEILLAKILCKDRVFLITHDNLEIDTQKTNLFNEWVDRRAAGEPVAYITEEKDFYKNTFVVKKGVLIPRPETEFVVEEAVRFLKTKADAKTFIMDMGCGSGCLGLSILSEIPNGFLYAVDTEMIPVSVTAQNALKLNLGKRISILQKDVSALKMKENFDCIVANPPYIDRADPNVAENVLKFEPHEALFAEEGGFQKIRAWASKAYELLKPSGIFIVEIGMTQATETQKYLEEIGFFKTEIIKDLSGKDRVVLGFKNG